MHAVLPSIIMVVGQPLMVLMNPQSRTVCVAADAFVVGNPTNDIPSSENTAKAIVPARAGRILSCVNMCFTVSRQLGSVEWKWGCVCQFGQHEGFSSEKVEAIGSSVDRGSNVTAALPVNAESEFSGR